MLNSKANDMSAGNPNMSGGRRVVSRKAKVRLTRSVWVLTSCCNKMIFTGHSILLLYHQDGYQDREYSPNFCF